MIQEIKDDLDLRISAEVIRKSFITVAEELNLTKENSPTNPAFITKERLKELKTDSVSYFGLVESGQQIGFVAVENAGDGLFYMMKLAVLPECRHRGHGARLVDFAHNHIRKAGGKRVSIGIINQNLVLKKWYSSFGYKETGTRKIPLLPFTVCFMEKGL